MSASKAKRKSSQPGGAARLQIPTDPAIEAYIKDLQARFGKYALPDDQVREIIDKAMGEKLLTEVLFQMREESL